MWGRKIKRELIRFMYGTSWDLRKVNDPDILQYQLNMTTPSRVSVIPDQGSKTNVLFGNLYLRKKITRGPFEFKSPFLQPVDIKNQRGTFFGKKTSTVLKNSTQTVL